MAPSCYVDSDHVVSLKGDLSGDLIFGYVGTETGQVGINAATYRKDVLFDLGSHQQAGNYYLQNGKTIGNLKFNYDYLGRYRNNNLIDYGHIEQEPLFDGTRKGLIETKDDGVQGDSRYTYKKTNYINYNSIKTNKYNRNSISFEHKYASSFHFSMPNFNFNYGFYSDKFHGYAPYVRTNITIHFGSNCRLLWSSKGFNSKSNNYIETSSDTDSEIEVFRPDDLYEYNYFRLEDAPTTYTHMTPEEYFLVTGETDGDYVNHYIRNKAYVDGKITCKRTTYFILDKDFFTNKNTVYKYTPNQESDPSEGVYSFNGDNDACSSFLLSIFEGEEGVDYIYNGTTSATLNNQIVYGIFTGYEYDYDIIPKVDFNANNYASTSEWENSIYSSQGSLTASGLNIDRDELFNIYEYYRDYGSTV